MGRDSSTDLAVLQLSDEATPLAWSDTPLRVGQLVFAVGRSGQGNVSASLGIVGQLGDSWRSWQG